MNRHAVASTGLSANSHRPDWGRSKSRALPVSGGGRLGYETGHREENGRKEDGQEKVDDIRILVSGEISQRTRKASAKGLGCVKSEFPRQVVLATIGEPQNVNAVRLVSKEDDPSLVREKPDAVTDFRGRGSERGGRRELGEFLRLGNQLVNYGPR